jgi:hypothetical protein
VRHSLRDSPGEVRRRQIGVQALLLSFAPV